jgi:hypothetical protein
MGHSNIFGIGTELSVAHGLLEVKMAQEYTLGEIDEQATTI